jgi:hypothetical protein
MFRLNYKRHSGNDHAHRGGNNCTVLYSGKFGDLKSYVYIYIYYFKQFQSLTMITQLELGITDGVSVSLVSPWVWRLAGTL